MESKLGQFLMKNGTEPSLEGHTIPGPCLLFACQRKRQGMKTASGSCFTTKWCFNSFPEACNESQACTKMLVFEGLESLFLPVCVEPSAQLTTSPSLGV